MNTKSAMIGSDDWNLGRGGVSRFAPFGGLPLGSRNLVVQAGGEYEIEPTLRRVPFQHMTKLEKIPNSLVEGVVMRCRYSVIGNKWNQFRRGDLAAYIYN